MTYAYRDRRARKGEFRKLWISRINAAARANDITYNRLIQGLKAAGVEVDRKNLAEIAVSDPAAFTALVEVAKAALPEDVNAPAGRGRLSSGEPLTERSARVAAAVKLHRHVGRRRAARFLAEGPNLVEAALRRGLVSEVFVTESALDRFGAMLADAPVHVVTERAAKALSDTVTPVGLVAVCTLPETSLARRARRRAAAGRRRRGDLRARKRGHADPASPTRWAPTPWCWPATASIPTTASACAPRRAASSRFRWSSDPTPRRLVATLRDAGLQVLATTLDGESQPRRRRRWCGPTAWLFGPEAHGLPTEVAAMATHRVRIPMPGSAESLNVASAAAICLYQSAHAARTGERLASRPSPAAVQRQPSSVSTVRVMACA